MRLRVLLLPMYGKKPTDGPGVPMKKDANMIAAALRESGHEVVAIGPRECEGEFECDEYRGLDLPWSCYKGEALVTEPLWRLISPASKDNIGFDVIVNCWTLAGLVLQRIMEVNVWHPTAVKIPVVNCYMMSLRLNDRAVDGNTEIVSRLELAYFLAGDYFIQRSPGEKLRLTDALRKALAPSEVRRVLDNTICYYPYDPAPFRSSLQSVEAAPENILVAGTMAKHKRAELALTAAAKASALSGVPAVGNFTCRAGPVAGVEMHENQSYEAYLARLKGARVMLFPSKQESFGFQMFEAWAAGVPVVLMEERWLVRLVPLDYPLVALNAQEFESMACLAATNAEVRDRAVRLAQQHVERFMAPEEHRVHLNRFVQKAVNETLVPCVKRGGLWELCRNAPGNTALAVQANAEKNSEAGVTPPWWMARMALKWRQGDYE